MGLRIFRLLAGCMLAGVATKSLAPFLDKKYKCEGCASDGADVELVLAKKNSKYIITNRKSLAGVITERVTEVKMGKPIGNADYQCYSDGEKVIIDVNDRDKGIKKTKTLEFAQKPDGGTQLHVEGIVTTAARFKRTVPELRPFLGKKYKCEGCASDGADVEMVLAKEKGKYFITRTKFVGGKKPKTTRVDLAMDKRGHNSNTDALAYIEGNKVIAILDDSGEKMTKTVVFTRNEDGGTQLNVETTSTVKQQTKAKQDTFYEIQ